MAGELEVVAWLDPIPMGVGYRVAITERPLEPEDWEPLVALSAATTRIQRAEAERDDVEEEVGRIIMALPPGTRGEGALAGVKSLRSRATAAEAQFEEARKVLEPFAAWVVPCAEAVSGWRFGVKPNHSDYIAARSFLASLGEKTDAE